MTDGHQMPATTCLTCGHRLDRAAALDDPDARPEPGAITLCIRCATVFVIDETLGLRLPTREEWDAFSIADLAAITRARAAIDRAQGRRR
jgi:hypothetical protein